MNTKLSLIILVISLSCISSEIHKIPFKLEKGKLESEITITIAENDTPLMLSLNSPLNFYFHPESYDPSSKNPKEISKISYPPVLENTEGGKLVQEKFKISENLKIDDMPLIASPATDGKNSGIFSLAPKSNINENVNNTLDTLFDKKKITKTVFSINVTQDIDGSYNGTVFLGGENSDFQTSRGDKVECTSYSDAWGCKFEKISLNDKNVNFKQADKITLNTEYPYAVMSYSYLQEFINMFPKEAECSEKELTNSTNKYYIECKKWSVNELELNMVIQGHQLKIKIPDMNNIQGIARLHYVYQPYIVFDKEYEGVFLPVYWFKGYHILFNKGKDENKKDIFSIKFHTYNDDLLMKKNEEEEENKDGYITISKAGFIILCVCLGVVFICLLLFIGYIRMTSNKPTRGLKSDYKSKTGVKKGGSRIATFDSALLGTSDENMPKRLKTSL